jgi:hypothetical protein
VLITGACFTFNTVGAGGATVVNNVTSVFAIEATNPANRINATDFTILQPTLIDAHFAFGSVNAGKKFIIFVQGPGGISRGLTAAVPGAPAGCPVGNELGVLDTITFTCSSTSAPPIGDPVSFDQALVNGCHLDRNPNGAFILDVFGKNLKPGADVKVGGITPKVIKPRESDPSFPGGFLRLTLKGRICSGLPGNIVITNPAVVPGGPMVPSQPFVCSERCPVN